jgi:hypothetical protein
VPQSTTVVIPASSIARASSTGLLVTQVRVTSPSRVTQTGTVVISGNNVPAITCASVSVSRAGTVTVRCSLTAAVRRILMRSGTTVSITTRISPKSGAVITTRTKVRLKKLMILPVTK